MEGENCCKALFHQLLILSSFTDSAAENALLEMDMLLIYIEINLTRSGGLCVCVCISADLRCVCLSACVYLCVRVGGMGGICVAWMVPLQQHTAKFL